MTPAWVEAAKGIPVWVGASVYRTPGGYVGTAYQVGSVLVYGMCHKDASGFRLDWRDECVPDLTDPDTRAMYLRRLAVALGCPEEVAADGVVVWTRNSFLIGAGFPDATHPWDEDPQVKFPWEFEVMLPRSGSTEEALALAWPADKRVTT